MRRRGPHVSMNRLRQADQLLTGVPLHAFTRAQRPVIPSSGRVGESAESRGHHRAAPTATDLLRGCYADSAPVVSTGSCRRAWSDMQSSGAALRVRVS